MSQKATYILSGAIAWCLTIQYFFVEYIVQNAWVQPEYSRLNTISDLGVLSCPYTSLLNEQVFCSPLHTLMNTSFIINSILTIIGLLLLSFLFNKNSLAKLGIYTIGFCMIGLMGVGFIPEDVSLLLHTLVAAFYFIGSNLGLLILGLGLRGLPEFKGFSFYTFVSGIVGTIALICIPLGFFKPIGIGVIERVTAYPFTLWVIVAGIYILVHRKRLLGNV